MLAGTLFAPKIGVNAFFVAVVTGQLSFSLISDQMGAFDSKEVAASLWRLSGVVIVVVGAAISQKTSNYPFQTPCWRVGDANSSTNRLCTDTNDLEKGLLEQADFECIPTIVEGR